MDTERQRQSASYSQKGLSYTYNSNANIKDKDKYEIRNPKHEIIPSELKCLKCKVPKVIFLTLVHFSSL